MKLADNITIDCEKNTMSIDGEQFPYYIQPGVSIDDLANKDGIPIVTLSVFAKSITVIPGGQNQ